MFNCFRKEYGNISELEAISYARKPIVRFIYKKFLLFEVSIQNLLGEVKANFVPTVMNKDRSGNNIFVYICRSGVVFTWKILTKILNSHCIFQNGAKKT